jgi:hypothetical protein
MGSGISPSPLEAGIEAGAATRRVEPEADTPATVTGTEANFIRVTTVDNLSGYVSRFSPLGVAYRHRV